MRRTAPAVVYGDALDQVATFAYPLDSAVTWAEPRGKELRSRVTSGVEATWDDGLYDHFLKGRLRWIVPVTGFDLGPAASGYNDSVRQWLTWAWGGDSFRWVYDRNDMSTFATVWLESPTDRNGAGLERDGTRYVDVTVRGFSEITGY